jgi:hypothetical protein
MTPWHAAALALVGWYLMVPPPLPGNTRRNAPVYTDVDAPIAKWNIIDSFDSAQACRKSFLEHADEADDAQKHPQQNCDTVGGPICRPFMMAKCIATDDPRLGK